MARGWKFQILKEEGLYYLCSENKGADQLHSYVRLIYAFAFAYAKFQFLHDTAQIANKFSSLFAGSCQLLSQGTAEILLSCCSDYWNGEDLTELTENDR